MTEKSKSTNEMAIGWLSEDLWGDLLKQNIRLRKCIIKGGLGDWLAVLSARIEGEAVVAFVGAASLNTLAKKLLDKVRNEDLEWRQDKFSD